MATREPPPTAPPVTATTTTAPTPTTLRPGSPFECQEYHNTSDWDDAEFDHDDSNFPLTGRHRSLDCESCHADGYQGTPTDCVACHQSDYNRTDDPDHAAAGFPVRCEECHNTRDWDDADFDHDGRYFPIYSGEHRNEWDSCSDCHTSPNNYAVFTCATCHSRSEMNREHDDVSGYVFEPRACLACHPDGEEDD